MCTASPFGLGWPPALVRAAAWRQTCWQVQFSSFVAPGLQKWHTTKRNLCGPTASHYLPASRLSVVTHRRLEQPEASRYIVASPAHACYVGLKVGSGRTGWQQDVAPICFCLVMGSLCLKSSILIVGTVLWTGERPCNGRRVHTGCACSPGVTEQAEHPSGSKCR
jgi:hypothetical protein